MKFGVLLLGLSVLGLGALGTREMQNPAGSRAPSPAKTTPTYAADVAPILNQHCVQCHRPNQVAPFSLIGYENAKKWSRMITQVTHDGIMPPWKAQLGYGEFQDENRLTADEIATMQDWASSGCPRGNPSKEPKSQKLNSQSEWQLGKPDLILQPATQFKLGGDGPDLYRNFVLKTNFKEPIYIQAMDVKPGNWKVVHHAILFLDRGDSAKKLEEATNDGQEGYTTSGGGVGFLPSGALGGWAPGLQPHRSPKGVAFQLDPGETIVLQIHYHRSGKDETDQTRVGLYFAKEPIEKRLKLNWMLNLGLAIPANDAAYTTTKTFTWPRAVTLYGVMPHMHLLGHSMKSWLEFPDGTTRPLVYVPNWDFNWQFMYMFKDPIHVPAGTKQVIVATYDNSVGNPNNPNSPPKRVRWGEQTTNEMFLMIVPYTVDDTGPSGRR